MFLYLRVFLLIQQNCLYQQFFILPEPISRRHFSNFTNFAFLYNSVIYAQDVRIFAKLDMNNLDLFIEMLSMDSSSSRERGLSNFLADRFLTGKNRVDRFPVGVSDDNPDGDGTENLLFSWGTPKIVFCTHLDTVPPYFPPVVDVDSEDGLIVKSRGACDAKGQIISMYNACLELEKRGRTGFGLLLLAGEESGSFGAKSFRKTGLKAEYVIVGEPTGNKMVSACKGTKSFEVTLTGKGCHSGYPEYGISAVDMFVDFVNELRGVEFPKDTLLGATTWNIGKLSSVNPQNILSPNLSFRIYFRTTFASDAEVCRVMSRFGERDGVSIKAFGGDTPMNYTVLGGFETTVAAFGSDAPQLEGFEHRCLCGPGSILVAHTMDEHVLVNELEKATDQYVRMFEKVTGR